MTHIDMRMTGHGFADHSLYEIHIEHLVLFLHPFLQIGLFLDLGSGEELV